MNTKNIIRSLAVALAVVPCVTSCDDYMDDSNWVANAEPQLDEYIDSREDLSLFSSIIDQGDLRGMVHALGTYTLFVPDNDAVVEYFGATSVDDAKSKISSLSDEDARFIVKYHMLNDTLHTTDFLETRLSSTNMESDYLISNYVNAGDGADNYYVINRKARITTPDVHTGNGILHVISKVLYRPEYSVQDVFANIDNYRDGGEESYSIITGLMKSIINDTLKTTIDELLNETGASANYTFLAQSNTVMEEAGLTTVDALVEALQDKNIGGYTQHDLLKNWVQYHFLKGRYYLTDVMGASSLNTCTEQGKVITVSTDGEDIYVNRFEAFDDPGIQMTREGDFVDFTCNNGTVQTLLGELEIIERAAARINWDMADQPEIRALKGFRKPGTSVNFYSTLSADADGYVPTDLSLMSWSGKNSPIVNYYCAWAPQAGIDQSGSKYEEYVYGDYLNFRIGTTVVQYMEIKTPTLVKGKYKVWLRYRTMGTSSRGDGTIRTTFKQDGQEDQVFGTAQLSTYGNKSSSFTDDEVNAAKGYYCPSPMWPNQNFISCCLLATIDVINDGVHTLRFDPQDANQSLGQNYDMLMFIPVDQDQVNPRICCDGSESRVYKVTGFDETGAPIYDRSVSTIVAGFNSDYRTHIFPYQCDVAAHKLDVGMCPKTWCPNHDPANFQEESAE